MNAKKSRVILEIAPEIQFELRAAPFRATLETDFERLKNGLLARQLDALERPELNAAIRRAANEAAALAWVTFYPLLVFPALFEEKIATAIRQAGRQARVYANSRNLLANAR
jgi:hypothetical protein